MSHTLSNTRARVAVSAVLLLAITAPSARSEETHPDSLAPGQRVRVIAASPTYTGIMTGTLVRIGPDSLVLADAEHNLVSELPRSSVIRVEVGHQRRQTKKWLLIGLGVGALGGLSALGLSSGVCGDIDPSGRWTSRTCTEGDRPTRGEEAGLVALSMGLYGGIGALIGHRKKTYDWVEVPVQDWTPPRASALTLQLGPTLSRAGRGAGLRMRLTW